MWWPTTFMRYRDRLFVEVELGTRRAQLVWDMVEGSVTIEQRAFLGQTEPTDVRFWGTLLDQVECRLRNALRDEGAFNARVARRLPLTSRTGHIRRRDAWPKGQRSPLTERQLARLERAVRLGAQSTALSKMSAETYLRIASVALVAAFRDLRERSPLEIYKRRADGRHGGLLDLARADAEAFRRWFQSHTWSGSHPWEIVFGHPHGIHLTPTLADGHWRFWLSVSNHGLALAAVKMAIALGNGRIPFILHGKDELVATLSGQDELDVGPFSRQVSLEELEELRPGSSRHVRWDPPPALRVRDSYAVDLCCPRQHNMKNGPSDAAVQQYRRCGEKLAAVLSALRSTSDLAAVAPAWSAFRDAHHELDGLAPADELEAIRNEQRKVVEQYMLVLAAFHEAAHAVVGHLMGLGVLSTSLIPTEDSFARATFATYDAQLDGVFASWARRRAIVLLAGFSGGLLVAPNDLSKGAQADFDQAVQVLKTAGLDPASEIERLQAMTIALVLEARDAVFGVALALLQYRTIDRSKVLAILLGRLDPEVRERLEKRRREL